MLGMLIYVSLLAFLFSKLYNFDPKKGFKDANAACELCGSTGIHHLLRHPAGTLACSKRVLPSMSEGFSVSDRFGHFFVVVVFLFFFPGGEKQSTNICCLLTESNKAIAELQGTVSLQFGKELWTCAVPQVPVCECVCVCGVYM